MHRLIELLDLLAAMKNPSVAKLLSQHGYGYESEVIKDIIAEWEKPTSKDDFMDWYCDGNQRKSEGPPPYDAATATGMYDPEG